VFCAFLGLVPVPASTAKVAATAAATTPAISAATATAAFTTATAAALRHWTGFIHDESSPHKALSIAGLNCATAQPAVVEFDESKPSRVTAEPVPNNLDLIRRVTIILKEAVDIRLVRFERQIADEQSHANDSLNFS